jgi:hypothetical protein
LIQKKKDCVFFFRSKANYPASANVGRRKLLADPRGPTGLVVLDLDNVALFPPVRRPAEATCHSRQPSKLLISLYTMSIRPIGRRSTSKVLGDQIE